MVTVMKQGLLGTDVHVFDLIADLNQRRNPHHSTNTFKKPQQKTSVAVAVAVQNPASNGNSFPNPSSNLRSGAFKDSSRVYVKKKDLDNLDAKYAPMPKKNPASNKGELWISDAIVDAPASVTLQPPSQPQKPPKQAEKKKKHYVATTIASLSAQDRVGKLAGLNGRLWCECLASKHGLLTNCLNCGKIVCSLEGPGPCPSCGNLVESAIQQVALIQSKEEGYTASPVIASNQSAKAAKKAPAPGTHVTNRYGAKAGATAALAITQPGGPRDSEALFPSLASEADLEALRKAEAQKERLLDYQRNSVARTRVFDTASDFDHNSDAANRWLSPEERALALKKAKELEKAEEERKRSRVMSIDLKSRMVTIETPEASRGRMEREVPYEEAKGNMQSVDQHVPELTPGSTGLFQNPSLRFTPQFIPPTKLQAQVAPSKGDKKKKNQTEKATAATKQPWHEDAPSDLGDRPARMLLLREAETGAGVVDAAAAAAMKKAERETKEYLKGPRRVQDDYDAGGTFSVAAEADAGAGVGDEPLCG
ncbi:hypothetical protein BC830DRAFT_723526 [Chytriomyces sp. MP71]|nr:hypothetical protein BC830DRAFT_723526 [Chytriomyces sp. MP71]